MQGVYRADWRLAGSGESTYQQDIQGRTQGMRLTDQLDVADLEDEAQHDLTFWEGSVRSGFPTEVHQLSYRTEPAVEVLDGGRLVNGGLGFRVETEAGQPLLLVARLHAVQAGAVRVIVDDQDNGLWHYPALPGEWLETAFRVPAAVVSGDSAEIRLEVYGNDPQRRRFALYYVWVWSGQPVPFTATPDYPLPARFGKAVELLGYDLFSVDGSTEQIFHPGESIRVVLYWRASAVSEIDAKAFVHLYDSEGEIVTQVDRSPYYGTRPPYTWRAGEELADPRILSLPSDLPDGAYTVAIGMYEPGSGARLPVVVAPEHSLSDRRILMRTIKVKNDAN
jgi:hypothetical protein